MHAVGKRLSWMWLLDIIRDALWGDSYFSNVDSVSTQQEQTHDVTAPFIDLSVLYMTFLLLYETVLLFTKQTSYKSNFGVTEVKKTLFNSSTTDWFHVVQSCACIVQSAEGFVIMKIFDENKYST